MKKLLHEGYRLPFFLLFFLLFSGSYEAIAQCTISANITGVTCNNMETSNPSDDKYSFTITVSISGGSGGGFWQSPELGGGDYGVGKFVDKQYTIAAGSQTFTINSGDGACSTTVTVTPPATCSPPCNWTPATGPNYASTTVIRNTNGTSDPNDDTVSGVFTVTGVPAGEEWSLSRKLTATGEDKDHIGDYPSNVTSVPWGPVPVSAAYPGQNGFVLWFMTNSVHDCLGDIFVTIPDTPACTALTNLVASVSPTSIAEGASATLNATGTGLITGTTTYDWSGSDGFSSSIKSPSTGTMNTAGGYTYTVTASNNNGTGVCTATATVSLTVTAAPCTAITNLVASVSPASIAEGASATLNATGTGLITGTTTYDWSGSDGFSSSIKSPSTGTMSTAGGYTYTVTASNNNGAGVCTATATVSLTVTAVPCTAITNLVASVSPTSIAEGASATLNVTDTGLITGTTTYDWSGSDGFSSSIKSPSTGTMNTAGGYTYTVTASNDGTCTATATVSLTVTAVPCTVITNLVASVSPASITQGGSATLNATGTGLITGTTTYDWSGSDGFSSSIKSPSTGTMSTAGGYTYTVTASNNNGTGVCTATATVSLTVSVATSPCTPLSNLVATATPSTLSQGGSTNLNVTGTGVSSVISGFYWEGTDGFTSSFQNPTSDPIVTPGGYTFSIWVTNANGTGVCTASATVSLTVSTASTPCTTLSSLTATATPSSMATGNSSTLNVTGTGITAGVTQYSWAGPNSFTASTQSPPTGVINTAGGYTYTVRATNANGTGVCTASATVSLTVTASPCSLSVTLNQSVCQNNGTNNNNQTADDYFNVTVSATATNGGVSNKFEVVFGANADGTGGNVLNAGGTTYGQSITINGLGRFQADGITTYVITIRDIDTPTCKTTRTTVAVASCSNNCSPNICMPITVQKKLTVE